MVILPSRFANHESEGETSKRNKFLNGRSIIDGCPLLPRIRIEKSRQITYTGGGSISSLLTAQDGDLQNQHQLPTPGNQPQTCQILVSTSFGSILRPCLALSCRRQLLTEATSFLRHQNCHVKSDQVRHRHLLHGKWKFDYIRICIILHISSHYPHSIVNLPA